MNDGEIIRSCPFCGESYTVNIKPDIDKKQFAVVCISDLIRIPNGETIKGCGASSAYYENVHEAIAMWNMRKGVQNRTKKRWWQRRRN